jgi:hypothetical protein
MNDDHTEDKAVRNQNLGESLVVSVSKSGAGDIAADASEIALDSVLDEGLLKDVPVFGWLIKSYSVACTIQERLFLKKIANFLVGTKDIPDDDRKRFLDQIDADPAFSKRVGESLVLLLDRHEDFQKSVILGKAFSRYVCKEIDYVVFLKLAKAIDSAFIEDLKNLGLYYDSIRSYDSKLKKPFKDWLDTDTSQSLYSSGLVGASGYTENTYHPNEIGEQLLLCIGI